MNRKGQVVLIVAFLIPLLLLLMAVGVDAGRVYLTRAKLQRAAQSAASSGISEVADQMVTQAVQRQTAWVGSDSGTPLPFTSPSPDLSDLVGWITDDDRATLVSPGVQEAARNEARTNLSLNEVDLNPVAGINLEITYPQPGYDPTNPSIPSLVVQVRLQTRLTVLLAGLLGESWTVIDVLGEAAIPQR